MGLFSDIENEINGFINTANGATLNHIQAMAASVQPSHMNELADLFDQNSAQLNQHDDALTSAVNKVLSGWQGQAAGAASGAVYKTSTVSRGTSQTSAAASSDVRGYISELNSQKASIAAIKPVDTSMGAAIHNSGGPVAAFFNPSAVADQMAAATIEQTARTGQARDVMTQMNHSGQSFAAQQNGQFKPMPKSGSFDATMPATLSVQPIGGSGGNGGPNVRDAGGAGGAGGRGPSGGGSGNGFRSDPVRPGQGIGGPQGPGGPGYATTDPVRPGQGMGGPSGPGLPGPLVPSGPGHATTGPVRPIWEPGDGTNPAGFGGGNSGNPAAPPVALPPSVGGGGLGLGGAAAAAGGGAALLAAGGLVGGGRGPAFGRSGAAAAGEDGRLGSAKGAGAGEDGRFGSAKGVGAGEELGRGAGRAGLGEGEYSRGGSAMSGEGPLGERSGGLGRSPMGRAGGAGMGEETELRARALPGSAVDEMGAGGRGGMGPMGSGGRRGGSDDDELNKRPDYLVESDDLWGDGRLAAPPVLG